MAGWACVARMGGIGDNLIAASVLKPLRRLGYKIEVITSETAGVVFLNNPHIDRLVIKGQKDLPPGGLDGFKWFDARSREYEHFSHLSYTCEGRHAAHVNSPAFWWPQDYRRKVLGGSYLETVHDVAGVAHDFGPLYFPTEEETERARQTADNQIKSPYVAWALSGSRVDKIYPYAAMAIGRIIRELGHAVVMVGAGGPQFKMAEQIMDHVRRQNGDTEGLHLALSPETADPGGHQSWTIRRSLAQAFQAKAVVTPDTGMAWAVAMEPLPKIVLLSHASADNITKHWVNTTSLHADTNRVPCWPCHRLHDNIDTCTPNKDGGHAAACISDISVETILREVNRAIGMVT